MPVLTNANEQPSRLDHALRIARRALLRDRIVRLDMLADLANAHLDHVAVAGKEPLGWFMIDGSRIHWSSYGEVHHPQVALKRLITRLDEAGVAID